MTPQDITNWPISEIIKLPNLLSIRNGDNSHLLSEHGWWVIMFDGEKQDDGSFECFGSKSPHRTFVVYKKKD